MKKYEILLLAIIAIITVITVKAWQRHQYYINIPDYEDMVRPNFDPSGEGGHLLPNLNMLMKGERLSKPVRIITNSKGFRNSREFNYDADRETFRILFLGDSFVDGMRVGQTHTMGYVLEEFLNKKPSPPYKNSQVLISGHGNPVEARYYYQEHGKKYNSNLIILGITLGNDITWQRSEISLLPVQDADGSWHLNSFAEPLPEKKFFFLPCDAYLLKGCFQKFVLEAELIIRKILARIYFPFGYDVPPVISPKAKGSPYVYANDYHVGLGLFFTPVMPEIDRKYNTLEKELTRINSVIKKDGHQLLVVLFPVRMQVSSRDWALMNKFYCLNEARFDLSYPDRRIISFCKNNHIDCLDLLPALKDYMQKNKKMLYFPRGDMHFNDTGQEVSGKIISEEVGKIISAIGGGKTRP